LTFCPAKIVFWNRLRHQPITVEYTIPIAAGTLQYTNQSVTKGLEVFIWS
jgi:hypothetical protein